MKCSRFSDEARGADINELKDRLKEIKVEK